MKEKSQVTLIMEGSEGDDRVLATLESELVPAKEGLKDEKSIRKLDILGVNGVNQLRGLVSE